MLEGFPSPCFDFALWAPCPTCTSIPASSSSTCALGRLLPLLSPNWGVQGSLARGAQLRAAFPGHMTCSSLCQAVNQNTCHWQARVVLARQASNSKQDPQLAEHLDAHKQRCPRVH